ISSAVMALYVERNTKVVDTAVCPMYASLSTVHSVRSGEESQCLPCWKYRLLGTSIAQRTHRPGHQDHRSSRPSPPNQLGRVVVENSPRCLHLHWRHE